MTPEQLKEHEEWVATRIQNNINAKEFSAKIVALARAIYENYCAKYAKKLHTEIFDFINGSLVIVGFLAVSNVMLHTDF